MTGGDFTRQETEAKGVIISNTHMSELPIVRIVPQVKCARREKLELSQRLRRSFLKEEVVICFFFFMHFFPVIPPGTPPHPQHLKYCTSLDKKTEKREMVYLDFTGHIDWFALAR